MKKLSSDKVRNLLVASNQESTLIIRITSSVHRGDPLLIDPLTLDSSFYPADKHSNTKSIARLRS